MGVITSGAGSTTPDLILGDSLTITQQARTIAHELMGGGTSYVFRGNGPRGGALQLFYLDEADAEAARVLHLEPVVFTIDEPDRAMIDGLAYVRTGDMSITLDSQTRERFILTINISEVV